MPELTMYRVSRFWRARARGEPLHPCWARKDVLIRISRDSRETRDALVALYESDARPEAFDTLSMDAWLSFDVREQRAVLAFSLAQEAA